MINITTFIPVIRFLSLVLGKNAEIILFDSEKIVHIENSFSNKKKAGDPIEAIERKLIEERRWEKQKWTVNYRSLTNDKKRLRSSTFFIEDPESGIFIGMLTINIFVGELIELRTFVNEMINGSFEDPEQNHQEHSFYESLTNSFEDLMNSVIKDTISSFEIPSDRLSTDEKLEIVKRLDAKGTFLIKGSIAEVAKKLNSSEATIYRYLNQISS